MKNVLGSLSLLALFFAITECRHTPSTKKSDLNADENKSAASTTKVLGSNQGLIAALDAKNGFRDTTFGDSTNQYVDMIQTKDSKELFSDDPTKVYVRKGHKLKLGDADLHDISYFFDQGRLTNVQIWIHEKVG